MHQNRYRHIVHEHIVNRVRQIMQARTTEIASLRTPADARAYILAIRAKVARCFPGTAPLKAQITGAGFMVSANLYLPPH